MKSLPLVVGLVVLASPGLSAESPPVKTFPRPRWSDVAREPAISAERPAVQNFPCPQLYDASREPAMSAEKRSVKVFPRPRWSDVANEPAMSAEKPVVKTSPQATSPADQEEERLRDPFASESKQAKGQPKIKDPLQPMNRAFFQFNDKLYFWALRPVAKGYSKVVPQPARTCVSRFFANVKYPVRLVNNLLQGKPKAAGLETCRFVVNSTVGVAGLFDTASRWKLQAHPADFDQTLGVYGLRPGIYFDWPVFGPSSSRGTAGLLGDSALSPWSYVAGPAVGIGVSAYGTVNGTSLRPGEYESFKKATLDPYVAMRSAYYESRAEEVAKAKKKGQGEAKNDELVSAQ